MKTLVIERNGILNNLAVAREHAGKAQLIAAVGGGGMGIGTVRLAKILLDGGVRVFAVDSVAEAAALRAGGLVEEQILMLRSISSEVELQKLLDLNVICTIGSNEAGLALSSFAERRGTVAEAHVQIDTGMGFGGFWGGDIEKILTMYRYLPNVALTGVYTTLRSQSRGRNNVLEQLGTLGEVVEKIEQAGFTPGTVHAAGSYALMNFDYAQLDAVRCGSVLLGRCRRSRGDGLTMIGFGESVVTDLRWLSAGQTVGVQMTKAIRKPLRVAAIPVGYLHGFGVKKPRPQRAVQWIRRERVSVEVGGKKAFVLGEIGAYDTLIDVTNLECSVGDTVSFPIDPLYARGFELELR